MVRTFAVHSFVRSFAYIFIRFRTTETPPVYCGNWRHWKAKNHYPDKIAHNIRRILCVEPAFSNHFPPSFRAFEALYGDLILIHIFATDDS